MHLLKPARDDTQDSDLSPGVEALPRAARIELGVLDHPNRLEIAQWKRRRESAQ